MERRACLQPNHCRQHPPHTAHPRHHISIFHILSAAQTHTQASELISTHMHIAPRAFWPVIPLMVINLEPVGQKGVLHISTKCVLESPLLFPKGHPNPSLSPSLLSFTFSPVRTHTKHPWWRIHSFMYFCDFSLAVQNFQRGVRSPKNESLAVC